VSDHPVRDPTGQVAGFADATGQYLGLAVTLNAVRVLDAAAAVLGVDHGELARLALAAAPGSGGLLHIPFLDGERTPNLPHATGSLVGMTTTSLTRENYARAAVEGLLCLMADGIAAVANLGVDVESVVLVGGAARSTAVQQIAPQVLGLPVEVPPVSEYVADGAARQAAWILNGGEAPPDWAEGAARAFTGAALPYILDRYRDATSRLFPSTNG
jgi:xylulokinase